ncbi:F-box/kelch-repeat protein At3g23880-like [Daucus carota subsp. sativus]|uniref:F-box/kelch-repeat protein At3g23880-like n=1 Tax=Daucus carota subsp. sativus TaxID=79200 RepID=UPI0030837924
MGSTEQSKNAKRKSSFDDLPPETVLEILLKLPVKSIIRSTLVNKTWHSLIKNPDFISAHIQRSVSCCDEESVVLLVPCIDSYHKYCSLVSTDTSSLIQTFEIPFNTLHSGAVYASLHGLVLFSTRSESYLWNPSLRTRRALVTSNPFDKRAYRRSTQIILAGLGFHKPTNDYRVVMVFDGVNEKGKVFEEVAPKAEIYSLRENAWKEIKNSNVPRLIREKGTYVDGKFYWLGTIPPETYNDLYPSDLLYSHDPEQLRILSFNFDTEEFGELLKLPDEVSSCVGQAAKFKLMEFEGSLCVCVYDIQYDSPSQLFCIWSMRSENGVISWSLRFRFLLKEGESRPLNITKSGSLIIQSYGDYHRGSSARIFSCNLKSIHDRDIGFSKFEYTKYWVISTVDTHFMESLVMYEGDQKSLLKSAE